MRKLGLILGFALVNFGGLALGSWLMNEGPVSEWYGNLDKAPWTPPGWVFGVAWTTIMICFSIYLGELTSRVGLRAFGFLFAILLILNVSWNYLFFNQHLMLLSLMGLVALTLLIWWMFFRFRNEMRAYSYLLSPYMIWLLVACSLNAYAWLNN